MNKGLRAMLWGLSSLAVLWTVLSIIGVVRMGKMMGGEMMRGDMSSMMGGSMAGGAMMMGMMLYWAITVIVMLGLDAVFVYLFATSRRPTDTEASLSGRRAA